MSREKDPECRGILLSETEGALCVAKGPNQSTFWIPRSQIGYLRIDRSPEEFPTIVFTCPEWLLEKKEMWSLVP